MAIGLGSPVWFLLLATSQPGIVQGKVVTDFQECDSFFKDGIPPQGFENMGNPVKICQMYKNHYHFATLYRTDLRIPVYSAYTYQGPSSMEEIKRPCPWFYEPQIDNRTASPEMKSSENRTSEKQAVDTDYKNSVYERGHLYPFSFNKQDSSTASCTLTNAIPMVGGDNKRWYARAEKLIKGLAENCHNSGSRMYVVTGSGNYTEKKMKNKVVVPGLIWSAACCTSSGRLDVLSSPEEMEVTPVNTKMNFSIAFMKELLTGKSVINMTVLELERTLNVKIFNQCKGTSQIDEEENYREVNALLNEIQSADPELEKDSEGNILSWLRKLVEE
ncbi:endonuclease domain-containing 1 protein-like [Hypanus sabinus]|uniref:endonuclease domain-containing 1 protein-like n=1 Tax=Hypanus sabinus TaxID=79690 RepID=UPI0028C425BA|nr:endonuclease domain-containing 1 protein-like [Hypanus sabinus]